MNSQPTFGAKYVRSYTVDSKSSVSTPTCEDDRTSDTSTIASPNYIIGGTRRHAPPLRRRSRTHGDLTPKLIALARQEQTAAMRRRSNQHMLMMIGANSKVGAHSKRMSQPANVTHRTSKASIQSECPSPATSSRKASSIVDMFMGSSPVIAEFWTLSMMVLDPGRDSALQLVYKQHKTRTSVLECYRKVKNALKEMGDEYVMSKETNAMTRYASLKSMVKKVVVLEKQYWLLVDVPKQLLKESPHDYVNRVMAALEQRIANSSQTHAATPSSTARSERDSKGVAGLFGSASTMAEKAKEASLMDTLKSKSTDELRKEQERLQEDLCMLCKKYRGLRGLLSQLNSEFEATKAYPIVPRYSLLKEMIKKILRSPAFAEVCQELDE